VSMGGPRNWPLTAAGFTDGFTESRTPVCSGVSSLFRCFVQASDFYSDAGRASGEGPRLQAR
jgi:hypothetical protein